MGPRSLGRGPDASVVSLGAWSVRVVPIAATSPTRGGEMGPVGLVTRRVSPVGLCNHRRVGPAACTPR